MRRNIQRVINETKNYSTRCEQKVQRLLCVPVELVADGTVVHVQQDWAVSQHATCHHAVVSGPVIHVFVTMCMRAFAIYSGNLQRRLASVSLRQWSNVQVRCYKWHSCFKWGRSQGYSTIPTFNTLIFLNSRKAFQESAVRWFLESDTELLAII